jgi:hypothetical protein
LPARPAAANRSRANRCQAPVPANAEDAADARRGEGIGHYEQLGPVLVEVVLDHLVYRPGYRW